MRYIYNRCTDQIIQQLSHARCLAHFENRRNNQNNGIGITICTVAQNYLPIYRH